MAKKKLISEPTSWPDLNIIGLSTQIKDYRLAFLMNTVLGFNLKRIEDLPVFFPKTNSLKSFPIFYCEDDDQRLQYYLIGNNSEKQQMISSIKHVDYFLFITGIPAQNKLDELSSSLKAITEIQWLALAEKEKIKNLEGIMEDLEMHLHKYE